MPRDADGFLVPDDFAAGGLVHPGPLVRAPPPAVEMPELFRDCGSREDAIMVMIGELSKPFAVEQDDIDTLYRRLADALVLILANQGGLTP